MSMSIVHGPSPHTLWVQITPSTTIYVGGIVTIDNTAPEEGIIMLPDAAGVANVTNQDPPLGICIGTNRAVPLFDTTYKTEYVTSPAAADAHDGASIEYQHDAGMYAIGDPVPLAKIALIDATTIIRCPLYATSQGTAPALLTCTTGDTDGVAATTNAADFTGTTSNIQTIYCRTGGNAGAYRTTDSNSSTAHTWDLAMRNDTVIGDTFVLVPVKPFGPSRVQFDSVSAMWIECDDAPVLAGTNRWSIFITKLDLSVAGKEYCEFRFDPSHFGAFTTTA